MRARVIILSITLNLSFDNIYKNKSPEPTYMTGLFIANKVHGSINVVWNADALCDPCPVGTSSISAKASDNNKKTALEFEATAWPVPSNTMFNLKVKTVNLSASVQIYVYDMSNKLVHSGEFKVGQEYQFGNNFEGGIYTVKVIQSSKIDSIKIIKY